MPKRHRALAGSFFNRYASLPRGTCRRCGCKVQAAGELFCLFLFLLSGRLSPGQSNPSPQVSAAGLKAGVQSLFAGDFAKAESVARQQLAANSQSVEALVLLGRAQMAQGRYPLAFSSLRKALDYSPNNIEALYFMGKLASALSQIEYQRLARLAPNSGRVHQLMGDSYQAAIEKFNKALELDPELPRAYDNLGLCYEAMSDNESGVKCYERASA